MTIWIRYNGQEDMREIVRTTIKKAGLTQDAAAKKAGIKYSALVGFLGGNNWFKRPDAEALAVALELSVDQLVGNSIFKEQADRYDEFDHCPPAWAKERREHAEASQALHRERQAQIAAGRTRAICCTCGALRTCSAGRSRWEPDVNSPYRPRDGHRVTEHLKCFECGTVTLHAVLLTRDDRDEAEARDRLPSKYSLAVRERDELVERLREFGVTVFYRRGFEKKKGSFYSSGYEFNRNIMQWQITLDENMPPRLQLTMLEQYWDSIANNDHSDVDWDVRDGVYFSPSTSDWKDTAEDLVKDIERFLHVERARLVLDVREEAGLTESAREEQQQ